MVMTVTIEHKTNGKYNYLVSWQSPEGYIFHDWFNNMKQIHEYFDRYYPTYRTL